MSMLSKVLKKVSENAPMIGDLLSMAVPGGGKVIPFLNEILGSKAKNESEILQLLERDPQAYVLLEKAEMDHEVELKQMWLEETKLYLADVQSARNREIEFVKTTGGRDWFQTIVGIMIITGFLISVVASYTITPPAGSERLLGMVQGTLGTLTVGVVQYLFGTNKSSSEKTAIIANMKNGGTK